MKVPNSVIQAKSLENSRTVAQMKERQTRDTRKVAQP